MQLSEHQHSVLLIAGRNAKRTMHPTLSSRFMSNTLAVKALLVTAVPYVQKNARNGAPYRKVVLEHGVVRR